MSMVLTGVYQRTAFKMINKTVLFDQKVEFEKMTHDRYSAFHVVSRATRSFQESLDRDKAARAEAERYEQLAEDNWP